MGGEELKGDSQVAKQMGNCQRAIERLTMVVGKLESALLSVLRNEPVSSKEEAEVEQALVPLAEDIRRMDNETANEVLRIESILDRLDL